MNTTTKKKNNLLFIGLVFLLIGCIGLTRVVFQKDSLKTVQSQETDYHSMSYNKALYTYNTSMIHILCMGIDSKEDKVGQADALMLLTLDRENKKISVLAIDRDTMTPIHLYDVSHHSLGWKKQHLALAYAYGRNADNGALLTCKAVSKLLYGIPINKYVAFNLKDLKAIQEIVGTLDVVVPNDSLEQVNPSWTKGNTVTLDTTNVEAFVRSRNIEENFSNEERMERQKVYFNAYYAKLKELFDHDKNTMHKLYQLLQNGTTNVTYDEVDSYAKMFQTYSYDETSSYYSLPGKNRRGNLHDEFIIDQASLKKRIVQHYYKKVSK